MKKNNSKNLIKTITVATAVLVFSSWHSICIEVQQVQLALDIMDKVVATC